MVLILDFEVFDAFSSELHGEEKLFFMKIYGSHDSKKCYNLFLTSSKLLHKKQLYM